MPGDGVGEGYESNTALSNAVFDFANDLLRLWQGAGETVDNHMGVCLGDGGKSNTAMPSVWSGDMSSYPNALQSERGRHVRKGISARRRVNMDCMYVSSQTLLREAGLRYTYLPQVHQTAHRTQHDSALGRRRLSQSLNLGTYHEQPPDFVMASSRRAEILGVDVVNMLPERVWYFPYLVACIVTARLV